MSCARNLVRACEERDSSLLMVLTKQIFGLCATYGVDDTDILFRAYCGLVHRALENNMNRDEMTRHFHTLVWTEGQSDIMRLLGYHKKTWRSMLTFRVC